LINIDTGFRKFWWISWISWISMFRPTAGKFGAPRYYRDTLGKTMVGRQQSKPKLLRYWQVVGCWKRILRLTWEKHQNVKKLPLLPGLARLNLGSTQSFTGGSQADIMCGAPHCTCVIGHIFSATRLEGLTPRY